jgi:hypothetical protein
MSFVTFFNLQGQRQTEMYKNKTYIKKIENLEDSIIKQVTYYERQELYDNPGKIFF